MGSVFFVFFMRLIISSMVKSFSILIICQILSLFKLLSKFKMKMTRLKALNQQIETIFQESVPSKLTKIPSYVQNNNNLSQY